MFLFFKDNDIFQLPAIRFLVNKARFKGYFTTMYRSMLIIDIVDKHTNSNRAQLKPYIKHPLLGKN